MFELKLVGKKDYEIIKLLGISRDTFYKWKKKYKDFKETYQKAVTASKLAKETLLEKALGFTRTVTEATQSGKLIEYQKYFPPDFNSIKYLIRNISDFDKELENKIKIDNKEVDHKQWIEIEKLKLQHIQLEHNIEMDKKKLELEEKKINTEDEQNKNLDTIKEFLNSTKINKEELEVLFDEE